LALIRSTAYEGDARYQRTVIPAQAGIQFSWVPPNTVIRSTAYEADARYQRTVIPAQAGIQFSWVSLNTDNLDSRLRGNDGVKPSTSNKSCQINGQ